MADKALPSPEVLRQLLRYEPETGKLFWLPRGAEWFPTNDPRGSQWSANRWNTRHAGTEALGTSNAIGYKTGCLLGQSFSAHVVIWALVSGAWPTGDIDHINMDIKDNRLSNLRLASRAENMRNKRARRDNKSGLKGVTLHEKTGKWMAKITVNGRSFYLGLFLTPELAHAAYSEAALRLHGEFARTS